MRNVDLLVDYLMVEMCEKHKEHSQTKISIKTHLNIYQYTQDNRYETMKTIGKLFGILIGNDTDEILLYKCVNNKLSNIIYYK